jgi:hypothetical protein
VKSIHTSDLRIRFFNSKYDYRTTPTLNRKRIYRFNIQASLLYSNNVKIFSFSVFGVKHQIQNLKQRFFRPNLQSDFGFGFENEIETIWLHGLTTDMILALHSIDCCDYKTERSMMSQCGTLFPPEFLYVNDRCKPAANISEYITNFYFEFNNHVVYGIGPVFAFAFKL